MRKTQQIAEISETSCPHCNSPIDSASSVQGNEVSGFKLRHGSLAICYECLAVLMYTLDEGFRLASQFDLFELDSEDLKQLKDDVEFLLAQRPLSN